MNNIVIGAPVTDMVFEALSDCMKVPALRVPHLKPMLSGVRIFDSQYTLRENVKEEAVFDSVINFFKRRAEYQYGWSKESVINHEGETRNFKMSVTQSGNLIAMVSLFHSNKPTLKVVTLDESHIKVMREELFEAVIKNMLYKPPMSISHLSVDSQGRVTATSTPVDMDKAKVFPQFYPYLKETPEELIKGFYESKARLMIFTGVWGAGKSSLLRSMVNYSNGPFMLVDAPAVYEHPDKFEALISHVRERSKTLQDGECITLMLEEADRIVGSKLEGHNTALPLLLSFTDGVLNFNVKVVVVTNLPSSTNFDGGLTRGGRHYKTVTFKELMPWEANEARAAIGLEPLGFLQSVALGSALGSTEGDMKHTTEKRGVGFTG